MTDLSRRRFLATTAALSAGCLLPPWRWPHAATPPHPRLYVTATPSGTLRSVGDVQVAIRAGHAARLWERIRQAAQADLGAAPITPATPLPGRTPSALTARNPDFYVCRAAGLRVLRHALVHLLTGDAVHRSAALRQIDTLFDPDEWPQWLDQAHERFGHPAGLRTGMLARDVGLAYDWLYPALTAEARARLEAGLDRYAIQPFLVSLGQDPWWIHDLNNWVTTIGGGVGVAALALGDAHPQSQTVLEAVVPLMDAYLTRYGAEGEFNESPAYANATERPVMFYAALRYASGGGTNRLAAWPFPQTCTWAMYLTRPPGHIAPLGDSKRALRPWMEHIAAVAAATRDGVLQHYYLAYADPASADPLELLWYDPSLAPVDPAGRVPLGRLFPAHGACFSSRSSWDMEATPCLVFGTLSREENHEHNDDGQVCIDGYGEPLIVDLGPPSGGYPDRFFDEDRWRYYNASVRGHNVPIVGGRERRHLFRERGTPLGADWEAIRATVLGYGFDAARGGWWQVDLAPTYEGVLSALRTGVHLLPGVVAVLDELVLDAPDRVAFRWHTADRCAPDADGRFTVRGTDAVLAGRLAALGTTAATFRRGEHAYTAPYDRNRDGDPLEQRCESYVEALVTADRCRVLSLFGVGHVDAPPAAWTPHDDSYRCETAEGSAIVTATDDMLVAERVDGPRWAVPLR